MVADTPKSCVSYTLLAVLTVGLLATSGDITMTWSSPIYPKLYSNDTSVNPLGKPITTEEDGWLGSLINLGAMVGPFPFGFLSEKIGRKTVLLCIAIPHFIAYMTMAFAKRIYLFYFARILGGLAVGGGYTLLPMYIAEIAEDRNRGRYSVMLGCFWAFGNFIPYAIGPYMPMQYFHFVLASVPLTFFILFSIIGVETPYYLVGANKIENAEKVLMKLRSADKKEIQAELERIKLTLNEETQEPITNIFRYQHLRKAFLVSVILIFLQQMSGITAVGFYIQEIFDDTGIKISSDVCSLCVGIFILLFSFFTPLVIEKFGRKPIHTLSCFGYSISLLLTASFFYVKEYTSNGADSIFWLPLASTIFGIFAFGMGMGTIPWTISSELFPKNMKYISAPICSCTCWITAFVLTKFFNNLTDTLGIGGTFVFFACNCIIDGLFTIFFVPETKGKSFMEIQEKLKRRISFIKE